MKLTNQPCYNTQKNLFKCKANNFHRFGFFFFFFFASVLLDEFNRLNESIESYIHNGTQLQFVFLPDFIFNRLEKREK